MEGTLADHRDFLLAGACCSCRSRKGPSLYVSNNEGMNTFQDAPGLQRQNGRTFHFFHLNDYDCEVPSSSNISVYSCWICERYGRMARCNAPEPCSAHSSASCP